MIRRQRLAVGLLVYGFKHLEAQVGSVIMPIEIIFVSIFGYVVFGETLSVGALIGGSHIAMGAFLPNIQILFEHNQRK